MLLKSEISLLHFENVRDGNLCFAFDSTNVPGTDSCHFEPSPFGRFRFDGSARGPEDAGT